MSVPLNQNDPAPHAAAEEPAQAVAGGSQEPADDDMEVNRIRSLLARAAGSNAHQLMIQRGRAPPGMIAGAGPAGEYAIFGVPNAAEVQDALPRADLEAVQAIQLDVYRNQYRRFLGGYRRQVRFNLPFDIFMVVAICSLCAQIYLRVMDFDVPEPEPMPVDGVLVTGVKYIFDTVGFPFQSIVIIGGFLLAAFWFD